jgi:hypothetical protein
VNISDLIYNDELAWVQFFFQQYRTVELTVV